MLLRSGGRRGGRCVGTGGERAAAGWQSVRGRQRERIRCTTWRRGMERTNTGPLFRLGGSVSVSEELNSAGGRMGEPSFRSSFAQGVAASQPQPQSGFKSSFAMELQNSLIEEKRASSDFSFLAAASEEDSNPRDGAVETPQVEIAR